jgi:transcription elongation factor GreB
MEHGAVHLLKVLWHPRDARWKDYEMRKGFTRKPPPDEPGTQPKNYITPSGLQRLKDEHEFLRTRERRAVTEVVTWAASNGDRSENADYQYGKRRLRQIDGRIRFLTKRIEAAEVVDPETPRTGQAAARPMPRERSEWSASWAPTRSISTAATTSVGCRLRGARWVGSGDSVGLQATRSI